MERERNECCPSPFCRVKPPVEPLMSAMLWQKTCQQGRVTLALAWFSGGQTAWQRVKAPAICHRCARVKVSGGGCSWRRRQGRMAQEPGACQPGLVRSSPLPLFISLHVYSLSSLQSVICPRLVLRYTSVCLSPLGYWGFADTSDSLLPWQVFLSFYSPFSFLFSCIWSQKLLYICSYCSFLYKMPSKCFSLVKQNVWFTP